MNESGEDDGDEAARMRSDFKPPPPLLASTELGPEPGPEPFVGEDKSSARIAGGLGLALTSCSRSFVIDGLLRLGRVKRGVKTAPAIWRE